MSSCWKSERKFTREAKLGYMSDRSTSLLSRRSIETGFDFKVVILSLQNISKVSKGEIELVGLLNIDCKSLVTWAYDLYLYSGLPRAMTVTSFDKIEGHVQMMNDEIDILLPHLIDQGLSRDQGLLQTACPESSEPMFKPIPAEKGEDIKHQAIPQEATSITQLVKECESILDFRVTTQHPNFFSFIPSTVLPVSWFADVIVSAFNPHAGGRLAGSSCDIIEKSLMGWLVSKIGFPVETVGLTVSGGSMANFMALTAARDKVFDRTQDHHLAVIYVSENSHFTIAKAARVLGFAQHQVRQIPGLKQDSLVEAIKRDKDSGLIPMAIVATLGSTTTGSIDPIPEVTDVGRENNIWVHVDGAYGASILLSESHRHLASGVEKADSLTWDAHKWLFASYGCGMLFVKDKICLARSFAAHSEFLDIGGRQADYEFWDLSLELTRPARAMRLWIILRALGTERIGQMLDHGMHLAEAAEKMFRARKHWKIMSPAKMAILAVRFEPKGSQRKVDEINQRISNVALDRNVAAVQVIKLTGKLTLRMCIINPRLALEDLQTVINALDNIAREIDV